MFAQEFELTRQEDSFQLYRAEAVAFPVGGENTLLYSRFRRNSMLLPRRTVNILLACRGFGTIDQHVERLREAFGDVSPTRETLCGILRDGAVSGFLVSASEIIARLSSLNTSRTPPSPITTIGIPTRNRPEILRRGLRSYIESAREYGRNTRFAVVDDSENMTAQLENQRVVSSLKKHYGVDLRYAGPGERARFAKRLAKKAGVPRSVVNFAILNAGPFRPSPGASRNALLLHSAGELLLQTDDDTVCKVADVPDSSPGLTLTSRPDPTQFWFFPDRDSAMNSVQFVQRDFLALHESLLGRDLASCISSIRSDGDWNIDTLGGDFLRRAEDGSGRILATSAGIVGDSGMRRTCFYLFYGKPSFTRLTESEQKYRAAMASQQVLRAVTRSTVSGGGHCSAGNLGLDNRRLLPPFMPLQKGEDTIFGKLLFGCFADAFVGFLPWALAHLSPGEARPDDRNERIYGDAHDFLSAIITSFHDSNGLLPQACCAESQLTRLGKYLVDLAAASASDFRETVRTIAWRSAASRLDRLEKHLKTQTPHVDYWENDLACLLNRYRKSLIEENYDAPSDLLTVDNDDKARRLFKELVSQFGYLLQYWPQMVAATVELRQSGDLLAPPG